MFILICDVLLILGLSLFVSHVARLVRLPGGGAEALEEAVGALHLHEDLAIHIYIYIYIYTHICLCTCVYVCIYIYIRIHIHLT